MSAKQMVTAMKNTKFWVRAILLVFAVMPATMGCPGETFGLTGHFEHSVPDWAYMPGSQYKVGLVFEFNRPVSQASLSAPDTFYMEIKSLTYDKSVTGVTGSFIPNGSWGTATQIAFVSDKTLAELVDPQAGESFEYIVRWRGGQVKDMAGIALVGDVELAYTTIG